MSAPPESAGRKETDMARILVHKLGFSICECDYPSSSSVKVADSPAGIHVRQGPLTGEAILINSTSYHLGCAVSSSPSAHDE